MKAICILLALCFTTVLSETVWEFIGSDDDYEIEVNLETPIVKLGQNIRGTCVVINKADQNSFQFEIIRIGRDGEEILANTADFVIPVERPEDIENLSCRVTRNGTSNMAAFSVNLAETNLVVRSKSRDSESMTLICQMNPPPRDRTRYRFRWMGPSGRVLANAPIAIVKKTDFEKDGPNGYFCESYDTLTHEINTQGLQSNSNISPAQRMETYRTHIERTPQTLRSGIPVTFTVTVTPEPIGPVTYSWRFNGAVVPRFTSNVYRIDRLQASDAGTYICYVNFMGVGGYPINLIANETLALRSGGRPSQSASLEIVPKMKTLTVGDAMTFHCNIAGGNPSQIEWRYYPKTAQTLYPDMQNLRPINVGWVKEETGASSFITKRSVTMEDDGYYICKIGDATDTAILKVEPAATDLWTAVEGEDSTGYCGPNERPCNDGRSCYPAHKVCDGFRDCADGTDEQSCSCDPAIRHCKASRSGQQPAKRSYNVNWECDGEDDCGNNYDEENCGPQNQIATCHPDRYFQCRTGNRSIPIAYLCDGSFDCPMKDDEERCPTTLAFTKSFQPNEKSVVIGESVTFTCTISAFPPPRVIWRFNWRCLPGQAEGASQVPWVNSEPNPRYSVRSSVTGCQSGFPTVTSELTISNVQMGDAGIFNCEGLLGSKRPMGEDMQLVVRSRY